MLTTTSESSSGVGSCHASQQLPVGSGVRIITRFNIKDKIIFCCLVFALVSFLSSNWLRDALETDIHDLPFQRGRNS